MKNIVITIFSVILIITFALLKSIWIGFVYFSIIFIIGISIYWIVNIALNYVEQYRTNLLEFFKIYCAKLINSSNVTSQMIEENKELYIKKFKKTLTREKLIEWLKILFLATLIIISVIVMSLGIIK